MQWQTQLKSVSFPAIVTYFCVTANEEYRLLATDTKVGDVTGETARLLNLICLR
jgi:hypothetical protein